MTERRIPSGPPCPVPYNFTVEHAGAQLAVTNMLDVYGDNTADRQRVHSIVAYDPRNTERPWTAIAPIYPEELERRPTESVN
jgi:hypothetical protein